MEKQRIAIHSQGSAKWTGGVEYTRNLLTALRMSDVRNQFHVSLILPRGVEESLFTEMFPLADAVLRVPPPSKTESLIESVQRKLASKLKIKLPQAPKTSRVFELCRNNGIKFIYPYAASHVEPDAPNWAGWIPDFQHKVLPQFFTAAELAQRDRSFHHLIKIAPVVVLSSEAARQDMLKFFPESAKSKSYVLRFASAAPAPKSVELALETQRKYYLPERYLMVCNQFWQHKNHLTVLKALKILLERGVPVPLVCTGGLHDYRQPDYINSLLKAVHSYGLHEQVRLLGLIPRDDQWQLLRRSCGVIQPSLFEGWSTVVEDAKSLGKHLFLSDLAVHREQAPSSVDFFSPENPEHLANLIAQRWPSLQPGPSEEDEREAFAETQKRLTRFGEDFFALAKA